jgi:hypothetical protein
MNYLVKGVTILHPGSIYHQQQKDILETIKNRTKKESEKIELQNNIDIPVEVP